MSSLKPSSSASERSMPSVPDKRVSYAPAPQMASSYLVPLALKKK